ncbi:fimbria/pilus outer membrane usher protein [Paraburkholderia sp. HP33-1]|uniref:fimbria/pilus outer membrane usher protein n=1 Tax=Paraburkholderia sp. HP33-1 TaxID=2883243 RepID=UPI001F3C4867|nr:fimbria/pilus outer membrane usher protein [Paraburkholderia sp. HP33-1]
MLLLLEVVINGNPTNLIADVVLRDGELLATGESLTNLGLRVPSGVSPDASGLYAIGSLPGVSVRVDIATETLYITAADSALLTKQLRPRNRAVSGAPVESSTGVTLNYDVNGAVTNGREYGSGLFDGRFFSPFGVASTDFLAFAGSALGGTGSAPIRLDSTYVYPDVGSQNRYSLGDVITGGLAWTRPVRLGGAQMSHDFSMRPDLVTFPVPTLAGSVAVPSTVDVLVNGTRALSQQVQPGPFEVQQLPVITGAGQVQLNVTNALGQQVTSTLSFYASPSLLAPGLQTYSLESGFVRRNWGILSNDYGDFAALGTYRRGLTDYVTIEAHAEGTAGQFMAGGGLVANLFNVAVVNFGVAGSFGRGQSGGEVAFGLQRTGQLFSFGVSAQLATNNFSDIAATQGNPVPVRQITASASTALGRWGTLGVAWAQIDQPRTLFLSSVSGTPSIVPPGSQSLPLDTAEPFVTSLHSKILTASYSVALFHSVYLYATGFHDFAQGSTGATVGVTIPIGRRDTVSASGLYQRGSPAGAQVQAQRSAANVGELGYQVYAAGGNVDHEFAQLQYKSPFGLFTVGGDRLDNETTFRLEAQGAVSFVDNRLFPTNTVNNSFAVVNTSGVGGVHVLYENRPAGVTDAHGQLLVPDLLPWIDNHLAIDPGDVPIDAQVPDVAHTVRPPDRSGVVVRFPISKSNGALLILVDEAGRPIPLGSSATLQTTGAIVPVGYDGEAFVENLDKTNQVVVRLPDGDHCVVSFSYTPTANEIPRIGPLTCRKNTP